MLLEETAAAHQHVSMVRKAEPLVVGDALLGCLEPRVMEFKRSSTVSAQDVVVVIFARDFVEGLARSVLMGLLEDPCLAEQGDRSVDGCRTHIRVSFVDLLEDGWGLEVAAGVQDGLRHLPARFGKAKAAAAQVARKLLALGFDLSFLGGVGLGCGSSAQGLTHSPH